MQFIRKYWKLGAVIAFFILIWILTVMPLYDFDIWFHIKSGELIAKLGIIHYDVFSYATHGREWFPYEWLFQITVYGIQQILGLGAIPYFTATVITIQMIIWYRIMRKIFDLPVSTSFILIVFFLSSIYEFVSARPHIVAYTILLTELYLILLYLFKKQNFLWVTIPLMFIWTNLHGSMFLGIALFVGYGCVAILQNILNKSTCDAKAARTLFLYACIMGVITVLPPLGFTQYRLLWMFWQDRVFLSQFIDEWTPLSSDANIFYYLTVLTILVALGFSAVAYFKKAWKRTVWIIPLLPFIYLMYEAGRNIYLGYITLTFALIWIIKSIYSDNHKSRNVLITIVLAVIILPISVFLFSEKRTPPKLYYPVGATQFIKDMHLTGHMFNEYAYGGYLLYHLYPQTQVFYDGRSDIYLCCEMRDTFGLSLKKNQSDSQFAAYLNTLWKKYDVSYVILRAQKHSVLRRIAHILTNDANWRLVFWDDNAQIFVRLDGKNDRIIEKYGALAATPYERNPFRTGAEDEALVEYQQMQQIADSAHTRNAIGYILLTRNRIFEAIPQFQKAIELDPTFESPYMNLAEIAASQGNVDQAIIGYQQALTLADDRGLIYLRLGELMLQKGYPVAQVRELWQEGVKKTVDDDAKKQLQEKLKTL